jgi:O-methyltransferase
MAATVGACIALLRCEGPYKILDVATVGTMSLEERYLALLRKALTRSFPQAAYSEIPPNRRTAGKAIRYSAYARLQRLLRPMHLALVQTNRSTGETMMGTGALENLHFCLHEVRAHDVPGDLVEAGVWRGGGTIYMRAFLEAYQDRTRNVWVADSFEGLPKPKEHQYAADRGSTLWASEYLAVSQEEVERNFAIYGLLDDRVRFLKGFFSDTMPTAPIDRISLLRLDGDMYESTIVVLEHLYPKLSAGGFVIIDDYGMLAECNRAVEDYRASAGITDAVQIIGYVNENPLGAFWRKS